MIDFLAGAHHGWFDPWAVFSRATVVFGVAALLSWSLRHRAARERHFLWTLAFGVLLSLPPLGGWVALHKHGLEATSLHGLAWLGSTDGLGAQASDFLWASRYLSFFRDSAFRIEVVLLLWIAGSLAALLSLGLGCLRFALWVRQGRPIEDGAWRLEADRISSRLGLRRAVKLIESRHVEAPIVGGLIRPALLLPPKAKDWDAGLRGIVLTHELLHVRSHDAWRQLLSGLVLALYWFHPLSWWSHRLAIDSREKACDEGVLQLGARPSKYAGHLLDLTISCQRAPRLRAVSMVHPSQLEARISAILESKTRKVGPLAKTSIYLILILQGIVLAATFPAGTPTALSCGFPGPSASAGELEAFPEGESVSEQKPSGSMPAASRGS